jgi:NDP-sugar pyrophosphorylase family protein
MNIIIPLGGKGERFKKEGYISPKPLIKILNKEIIFYVLDNLNLESNDKIFIIYNKELEQFNFEDIIKTRTKSNSNIYFIKLDTDTKGASETINIGIKHILDNIDITNIHNKTILIDGDTFYTQDILSKYRTILQNAVFYTKNTNPNPVFSYIKLDDTNNSNNIIDIQEKVKISDNANTGAYCFNSIHQLLNYSQYILDNNIQFNNECYTSCIIHEMIKQKEPFIGIELNSKDVHVLGTPTQVEEFIHKNK